MKVKITPHLKYRWYHKLFNSYPKSDRKISVHLDPSDTWSMDATLSHIITPMLIQLRASQLASPGVDDEDVPEELRSASSTEENKWHIDDNHHKRWLWVLDEMIWAFDTIRINDLNMGGELETALSEDNALLKEHSERMNKAFMLFGKHYQNLWD